MKDAMKVILLILVVLYVISPVDLAPGPIDDIIVAVAGLMIRKGIGTAN